MRILLSVITVIFAITFIDGVFDITAQAAGQQKSVKPVITYDSLQDQTTIVYPDGWTIIAGGRWSEQDLQRFERRLRRLEQQLERTMEELEESLEEIDDLEIDIEIPDIAELKNIELHLNERGDLSTDLAEGSYIEELELNLKALEDLDIRLPELEIYIPSLPGLHTELPGIPETHIEIPEIEIRIEDILHDLNKGGSDRFKCARNGAPRASERR
ncbi:hypothetical protein ACFL4Q_00120 [candidate division KSB1 bacterium]